MGLLKWCALLPATAAASLSVFGHKVPDTDTVTAAIVYAWELNARNISAQAYRLGELNPETEFVLKALEVPVPPLLPELSKEVAVVDTNNPEELPEGIQKTRIHSIVDHHKLSGLANAEPLEVDMRPLCSATSILYSRSKLYGLTPTKQMAGLMLSGILSDSLEFRSPTTTELDKVHAAELGKLAGLDVHEFAEGMLDAKAKVDHLSCSELIMMDTKIFNIGGKKLRVSVLETTKAAGPLAKKAELVTAMKELKEKEKIDDVLFFVVDILKESATFISSSSTATTLVEKAWKVKVDDQGLVVLPKVLSRKKQIIPKLEAAAKEEL
ncbi:Probable manganese-dependent inorganic pyrophosphatase (Pyrophosphate phospho-hydrolase) (PPase) [Durusdinium trenchii]|uniref:inorganic diphosphatase n=1 Tax=Durusdinium trenchii TaxID=1381693 RepID=A0ABP0NXR6_9DINO